MKRVAVIGAGVAGLACAFRLKELARQGDAALEVTVYDSAARAGGSVATETRDGFVMEKGPDAFISEKPHVMGLCERLAIADRIISTRPENKHVLILKHGRFVKLPEGFYLVAPSRMAALVATPLFSWKGKVRMAAELAVPKRVSDADESVASFIGRRFGAEALDRVGQPMIAGIHSGDPERLSAAWTIPQFRDLESRHGSVIRGLMGRRRKSAAVQNASGARYGLFLSFREGMETLTRSLEHSVCEDLRLNAAVRLDKTAGGWIIRVAGENTAYDAICLASSARAAAKLLRDADVRLSERLSALRFESVLTLNLAYERCRVSHRLEAFGFVAPALEKMPFTACTFSSQKFAGRAPEGYTLLRAFIGGASGRAYFEMDDADLLRTVSRELDGLLGIRAAPLFSLISRHPEAIPQYDVDHRSWLADIEKAFSAHAGLYMTGSSYRGSGISNCVKDADTQAERIYGDLFSKKVF